MTTTDTPGTEPNSTETEAAAVDSTETPAADSEVDEDQGADEDQDDAADEGPGREAAKYRRRLRDTEAERDALAARVEALQRAEVERQATVGGLKPAALWASGTELAGLLGDDGTVDESKVSAAIAGARESLGIPKPPGGNYVKGEGQPIRRSAKPSGKEAMVGVVMGRGVAGDD
ncbi:hypothetical protein [Mycobacterium sp. ENV421]|uniref:hypothetical protein n=1 Tax=Mycobacterium sp. ENV421 TaxID=1213407 RepID=UPI00115A5195|nr:hypothetical protein [Mycobacterium sp. ENV421]